MEALRSALALKKYARSAAQRNALRSRIIRERARETRADKAEPPTSYRLLLRGNTEKVLGPD